jgi:hypothetical protein
MTKQVPKFKPAPLIRPTLDTAFHIDYEWWERQERDLRVYLHSYLCPEHRAVFEGHADAEQIDWIDEDTAEVTPVDGLRHVLRVHCSMQPDYITPSTTLIDAVFRVFLANNNKPLTPVELGAQIRRDPAMILKTLSGHRVYKGLRPYTGN